jgi:hypothetical protein
MSNPSDKSIDELTEFMAALDALALAPASASLGTDTDAARTIAWMERLAAEPGGLELLVGRYGATKSPALLRPLTLLLTRTIAARSAAPPLGSLTLLLIEELACDDDPVRVQLLDALRLLGTRNAVPAPEHPPASLHRFVAACLARGPKVQAAAVSALTSLLESEVRFPPDQLVPLRQALGALPDKDARAQSARQALARHETTTRS